MCQNLLILALDAGMQKDRPYQSDFYRAGFNAIPRQAREQDSIDTPSFYSSGSVNQKVEPEPFTESTPIASFKLSMMVLLIVFRNIRLLKYIDVDIHTFSIKEIQISLLLNSVYICSYRDNY